MKELAVHCMLYFEYDEEMDATDPYFEAEENLEYLDVDYQVLDCEFRDM